jgi:transmembrane sensor
MESSTEIEERAADWLAQRDRGVWSAADEAKLAEWLHASTAHRVAFLRLDAAWQQANRLNALGAGTARGAIPPPGEWGLALFSENQASRDRSADEADPVGPVDQALSTTPYRGFRHWKRPHAALAASLVLIVALAAMWSLRALHGSSYSTTVGGLAAIPMPDGSRVTLNTDSKIRVSLSDTERRVNLERGEAFFEVAKDASRPFVVVAGDKRVIAVGTQFSVRREGDDIRVAVSEGRVRLEQRESDGHEPPVAQVSAGGIARADSGGVLIERKTVPEVEDGLSWRNGFLVFRDIPLADAVAEFNRYNEKKLVIETPGVAAIRIGGNFRSTNVEAFVRLLSSGFPIHAKSRGDQIVLSGS